MNKTLIFENLRSIPDFPKPGILFRDVTTLFKNPACLKELTDDLVQYYQGKGITKVVGIESRGFVLGAILAERLHVGFVPIRKPGKLPADTLAEEYALEYGTDRIEIHRDALTPDDVVLIHDDLLATGGTLAAACRLCQRLGVKQIYTNCLIELVDLKGRSHLPQEIDVYCPIVCEGE